MEDKLRDRFVVEIAVETCAAAEAAAAGGAQRIELAPDLAVGGLTPSDRLTIEVLQAVDIPVFAMVRPRAGDFVYSQREIGGMCRAIERLCALGVHGVVTGALTNAHDIDVAATTSFVSAAAGVPVTFHRAFDRVPDQSIALEQLVDIGVLRVLTSGGAATASDGMTALHALVTQAHGRIVVLAGGGVRETNVIEIVQNTGVTEVHTRLAAGEELTAARVREFCNLIQRVTL
jgi:copper homeostasis protein